MARMARSHFRRPTTPKGCHFRLTSVVMFLGFVGSASALVPGSLLDINVPQFPYVGVINSGGGASGVLVGTDTVLTARHVGSGDFTLPGMGTFTVVPGSQIDHPTDDLTLFKINATLSQFATISVNPMAVNDTVTMVGFGDTGTLNVAGTGYDILPASGNIRRAAPGVIDGTVFLTDPGFAGHSYFSVLRVNGQGAHAGGDSGGGWFKGSGTGNELVAINSWIGAFGTANPYEFSNDPNNFFASGAINLSQYNDWFAQNNVSVVPEPTTFAALGAGIALLVRRKRRR